MDTFHAVYLILIFFFNKFSPVEKCRVTPSCLYRDSLTFNLMTLVTVDPRKYNIRRNVNLDISVVTIRRVAIIFYELGVIKNFMQKF